MQAPCQVELENWVNSIHSACAAAFARHRGKTGTLHLLQEEIYRLEKAIESVSHFKYYVGCMESLLVLYRYVCSAKESSWVNASTSYDIVGIQK